ncbi:MAG: glycosyltransferase [Halothiobacillus sp.]
MLAADVYVFHSGGVSFGSAQNELQKEAMAALLDAHPDYLYHIQAFTRADPLEYLRESIDSARLSLNSVEAEQVLIERAAQKFAIHPVPRLSGAARLHITHSWGGGIERWIDDFSLADVSHRNYILCSVTDPNAAGAKLELWFTLEGKKTRFATWTLATPIRATDTSHAEYANILREVIDLLKVQAVLVSSLIGHSLEALATQVPTVVILHDMYPFCPAIYATFEGSACTKCDLTSLQTCHRHNPMYFFWNNTNPEGWVLFRRQYLAHLQAPWIHLVAPTKSARDRWLTLFPGLRDLPSTVIMHGIHSDHSVLSTDSLMREGAKLRIVIPGRLSAHKGLHLLRGLLPDLTEFAEILLLGSGDFGWAFSDLPGVTVVSHYPHEQLSAEIDKFKPDCALLLSVVPEMYSYTLSEMSVLGIPVVATRLGAFEERIEHGKSGWLVVPHADAIKVQLRELFIQRDLLEGVASYLRENRPTDAYEMVRRYQDLLPEKPERSSYLVRAFESSALEFEHKIKALEGMNRHLQADIRHLQADIQNANLYLQQAAQERLEHHRLRQAHRALNTDFQRLQVDLNQLDLAFQRLSAEFGSVLVSRSWKLTAPIRWFASLLRNGLRPTIKRTQALESTVPEPMNLTPENLSEVEPDVPLNEVEIDTPIVDERYQESQSLIAVDIKIKHPLNREEFCTQMGVPWGTKLIVLSCFTDTCRFPDSLVAVINACLGVSNSLRFIISDVDLNKVYLNDCHHDIKMLVSQRYLIAVQSAQGSDHLGSIADVVMVLGFEPAHLSQTLCGILREVGFLVVPDSLILPPEFCASERVLSLDQVSQSDAIKAVLGWLDKSHAERERIVARAGVLTPCGDIPA